MVSSKVVRHCNRRRRLRRRRAEGAKNRQLRSLCAFLPDGRIVRTIASRDRTHPVRGKG